MISPISSLVNTFSNYLSNKDYVSAHSFAVKNNLLLSHMNNQGKTCASYMHNILEPYMRIYGSNPDEKFIEHVTPLLNYFLEKEPHYWYCKKSVIDSKNEVFIFLLTYMIFNNPEKVTYFLTHMDKDTINTTTLKNNYLNSNRINFKMVNVIEQALLPEKINLKDLISIQNNYPENFKDSLAIYESHKKNNKISYKHDDAVALFIHIFDRRKDNDLDNFTPTLDKTIAFLKPLLLKNYTGGYSEETISRYIDIFQNVFKKSVDQSNNSTFSFDKSFIIPGLTVLQQHFPDTDICSYLKQSYRQMNTLASLGIEVDLSQPYLTKLNYEETKIKEPLYVTNLNKDYLREVTQQCFNSYLVLILINKLDSKYISEDVSLKHARIEDYKQHFPQQFQADWDNFKKGLELLEIPLVSSDKELNSYLQYLNLDTNINTKDQVKIKKLKI